MDEVEIEAFVREWLQKLGDTMFRKERSTGMLRALLELQDSVVTNEPTGYSARGDLELKELVVEQSHGESAVVKVRGIMTVTEDIPSAGVVKSGIDLTGDVRLLKDDEGWKVVDYATFGRSMLQSFFPGASGSATKSGVEVKVKGVLLSPRATAVFVDIINRRSDAVRFVSNKVHRIFRRDLYGEALLTVRPRSWGWLRSRASRPLRF